MPLPSGNELILFVSGEPDTGVGSLHDGKTTIVDRLVGMGMPYGGHVPVSRSTNPPGNVPPTLGETPSPPSDDRPWRLPPDQVQCVDMVLRIARRERRTVTVVDVNRAGAQQDLVHRWVGPNDVLPLLARMDGSRLEGIEEFVPQKVRKFIHLP